MSHWEKAVFGNMTNHPRPFRHNITEINQGVIFKTKPDPEKEQI